MNLYPFSNLLKKSYANIQGTYTNEVPVSKITAAQLSNRYDTVLGLFAYPNLIALDLENQKSNSVVPGILIHTNPDFSIDPSLNAL